MHPKYIDTVEQLKMWSQRERRVHGALILGSQVRKEYPGDEWSDLDVLLLVDEPQVFLQDEAWLAFLGEVICVTVEETNLAWLHLTWAVKRVLFSDHRALDFSIMPYERVDDVLEINADIHANGYQVIYDDHPGELAFKIAATLVNIKEMSPKVATMDELQRTVQDLLFQLIYACKKIKRNELWVAVSCINQRINSQLLQLIECYNTSVAARASRIHYEGRLLEQRTPNDLLERLNRCFTRYDVSDAIQTAGYLIEFTCWLANAICEQNNYPFDNTLYLRTRKLYDEMFRGSG